MTSWEQLKQPPRAVDYTSRWLRALNYEVHLIQWGLMEGARRRPWLVLVPAAVLVGITWVLYLCLYVLLLVLVALTALGALARRTPE